MAEIASQPKLSIADEMSLLSEICLDEEAKKRIINAHLVDVTWIVSELDEEPINVMDAIQDGNVALIKAVDEYSPPSNCSEEDVKKFRAYLRYEIEKGLKNPD